jgi:hypothetical protein
VSIDPVEPPAVARPLADVAAEQERAVAGRRLPDPGVLVTADEASLIRLLSLVAARLPGLVSWRG